MRFLSSLMTGAVVCGLALAWALYMLSLSLPDYQLPSAQQLPYTNQLLFSDSSVLFEYADEPRNYVAIEEIPETVQQAFLAAEDRRFFEHPGVDFISVLTATIRNLDRALEGKPLHGASTISQQVARNLFLTQERTMLRKLREMMLAIRLERNLSKREILELYLNSIYFGDGAYGIGMAAQNYFDTIPAQLSLSQAALLAALPKAPSNYNPRINPEDAMKRRNRILDLMVEAGWIPSRQAGYSKEKPVILAEKRDSIRRYPRSYLADALRQEVQILATQEGIISEGITVQSTLDPMLQLHAERALQRGLSRYQERHGYRATGITISPEGAWAEALSGIEIPLRPSPWLRAVVRAVKPEEMRVELGVEDGSVVSIPFASLEWMQQLANREQGALTLPEILNYGDVVLIEKTDDPALPIQIRQIPEVEGGVVVMDNTGAIRAMVGGFSFARSEYNRVTQARRQPGSAIKPFIALAAMEAGMTPETQISDDPITVLLDAEDPQPAEWTPRNFGDAYHGMTTIREGIEQSYNAMMVRLGITLGMESVAEMLQRFGLLQQDAVPVASMLLGSEEVNLLELTTAYAMLAEGGKRIAPSLIAEIRAQDATVLYTQDTTCARCPKGRVADVESAQKVFSMLQDVVENGTAIEAKKLGIPMAGKTGTSNQSRDAWFVGITEAYVVGVYVGYDKPRSLGEEEVGGTVALPIAIDLLRQLKHLTPQS